MSIVVRPPLAPTALPPIALVAGLAVRAIVAQRLPTRDVAIKWPNDVVVRRGEPGIGRKVAGILVEGAIAGMRVEHAIVGIGINVARRAFDGELAARATSLAIEADEADASHASHASRDRSTLDRGALVVALVRALRAELDSFLRAPAELGRRLAPFDALRGERVRFGARASGAAMDGGGVEGGGEGCVEGIGDGVHDDGRLRVRDARGVVHLAYAGEITVVA